MNKKNQQLAIGLDIGGSKILGLLYDQSLKKTYADYRQPIIKDSLPQLIEQIYQEINRLISAASNLGATVTTIGLGIPGLARRGKIITCPNLTILNGQNLVARLTKKFPHQKILVDNDVNCFLKAYLNKHSKLNKTTCAIIALGTGIGGAIAFNGQNITKQVGISSEIGHMILNHRDGTDLENYYHQIMGYPAGQLFTAAQNGNLVAIKKVEKFATILGVALANLNNLISPQTIILTGGVARYHRTYLPLIKKIIANHSITPNSPHWIIGHDQTAAAIGASLFD